MKKRNALLIVFLLSVVFLKAQVSFGNAEKINDSWRFILHDVEMGQDIGLNDSRWQKINLPHDWSVKGQLSPTLASCTGYLPGGTGWYRKTIQIPESKKGEHIYLYFEGVYNRSEVYLNGKLLGKRPNGYISFLYDATPFIEFGKENVIAVRVDHSQSADSRWYTGSGIYRDVWMITANPVHIAQWGVYVYPRKATTKEGVLNVEVEVSNGTTSRVDVKVYNELFDPNGKSVFKSYKKLPLPGNHSGTSKMEIKVPNPRLWDLDNPNLYQLKTTVMQDENIIDETITKTGFRTFTFDPDKGFALNGKAMKMKGVCIHHDAGVLGAAFYRDVWERRIKTLKEIGCNAIRTSHNPQAPGFYELCDELGMLVIDEAYDEWEFPKRKWLEGWNVGTPGFQGAYDFFAEWGEKDLADLVRRDRNYLSIFAWSIGNEVDYPNDPYSHPILGGAKSGSGFTQSSYGGYNPDAPDANRLGNIAKSLVKVVKEYDKSRPTTAGLAGVAMSNETEYPSALDIAGYNYTESRYVSDHEKYPKRVIYGSETRHELATWKAVRDNEHIFGQFIWTGIDYLGESGRWPSRGFYSGMLDFGGFIKPRGYYRQSVWSGKPMAYLGTYPTPGRGSGSQMQDVWSQLDASKSRNYEEKVPSMDAWSIWNYEKGQSIRVVCYTNSAKAKLMLNGKEVGETKDYNSETGMIFWDIPFQPGKLEVIGLDRSNREVTRYAIQTSKQPYALKIESVEKTTISKEKGLAQVVLQVVDEDGIPVMISDNEVTCRIAGPARLLGLEAGNNSDMTNYNDPVHRVYHGRILAFVQATGEEGDVHIRFTSPWLESAETTITVR